MRTAERWMLSLAAWGALVSASCAEEKPVPAKVGGQTVALAPGLPERAGPKEHLKELDWPQFRGPNRDDLSTTTGLLKDWPKEGPKLLWTARTLGRGYSGPAIAGGRIYVGGADAGDKSETIACLNLADGSLVWTTPIGDFYSNNWGGGPRATPTVDGDHLYMMSGKGNLNCLKAETGEIVWSKNLVSDFGGKVEVWGYSESVLIDGDKLICTPGGQNTMIALNKLTGEPIWKSTGVNEAAQYASPIKATVGDVTFYMTLTKGGVIAVDANSGEFLWRFQKPGNGTAAIPTPIFFNGDHVYATSGYGAGGGTVKLTAADGKITADEVFFNKEMINHHGGVLMLDGKVFGYSEKKGWICQDPISGEAIWRERQALGKGSITYADGRFYCYSEKEGICALVEASPVEWKEHGRFQIPEETKLERGSGLIWTHPVIAQGKLFLRDQDLLFCYEVTDGAAAPAQP